MENMTEELLVAQMKRGDRGAFAQLYQKYRDTAYRTACLICGNAQDGEDIVQETFIKAFVHCQELRSDLMFRYWFFRILNRTAWQFLNNKRSEIPDEHILEKADLHPGRLTEDLLMLKEQQAEIYQAVLKLDYKLRLTVILYYYNEMSTKQIARVTGCYEGTVRSRLFTARKRLARLLPEERHGDHHEK